MVLKQARALPALDHCMLRQEWHCLQPAQCVLLLLTSAALARSAAAIAGPLTPSGSMAARQAITRCSTPGGRPTSPYLSPLHTRLLLCALIACSWFLAASAVLRLAACRSSFFLVSFLVSGDAEAHCSIVIQPVISDATVGCLLHITGSTRREGGSTGMPL
jgi:hypothetical protein